MKSVDALLDGLVDYAGLFPPSGEDMRPALENYASYLDSNDRRALGRFIVPISRLGELEEEGRDLMPRGKRAHPWRLSVLVAEDVRAAAAEMAQFNRRHSPGSKGGSAVIDVAELKASTPNEIAHQADDLPSAFTAYFEIPVPGDISTLVGAISSAGARAKIRTGGITAEAFPRPEAVIDFIAACRRARVAFKATAGLHHPLRGEYRLTYAPNSSKGLMYGYLNVFLAATLLHGGEKEVTALQVLEESDPDAFGFDDDSIVWRARRVSTEDILASRSGFAISFGSCSFREPIDELAHLTRRARSTAQ
jgi:hypothetical protein